MRHIFHLYVLLNPCKIEIQGILREKIHIIWQYIYIFIQSWLRTIWALLEIFMRVRKYFWEMFLKVLSWWTIFNRFRMLLKLDTLSLMSPIFYLKGKDHLTFQSILKEKTFMSPNTKGINFISAKTIFSNPKMYKFK